MVGARLPGHSLHEELALIHAAGLPIEAVLRSTTTNAYAALGLEDRGRIAPGQIADFLVLGGDRRASLHHLAAIEAAARRDRYLVVR